MKYYEVGGIESRGGLLIVDDGNEDCTVFQILAVYNGHMSCFEALRNAKMWTIVFKRRCL